MSVKILRREAVEDITGLPTSSLYDEMAAGRFPRPVKLSARRVGWLESEVDEWLAGKIAERDNAAGTKAARGGCRMSSADNDEADEVLPESGGLQAELTEKFKELGPTVIAKPVSQGEKTITRNEGPATREGAEASAVAQAVPMSRRNFERQNARDRVARHGTEPVDGGFGPSAPPKRRKPKAELRKEAEKALQEVEFVTRIVRGKRVRVKIAEGTDQGK